MMNVAVRTNDRFVTVDGLNIRYLEEGSGVPAILLHGSSLGSSADVFRRNLQRARRQRHPRHRASTCPASARATRPTTSAARYRKKIILNFMDALGARARPR